MRFYLYCCLALLLSSCAPIARIFSTPTYSLHSADKIQLDNKGKADNVFIKQSAGDNYGIQKEVLTDIEQRLKDNGINIVSNIDYADYVLSINLRNVSVDVDYEFASSMRNMLLAKETNYPYTFDGNNMPHIDNGNIDFSQKTQKKTYKRILPATLYTMLGSGVGFTAGFVAAGSTAPFAFGIGGAVIVGGLTYITYDTFRKTGAIVSYDIIVEERNSQTLKHSRKVLVKKSSNSSDEIYYSYNDRWNTLTEKNVVIAIGSRALLKDMIKNICPMIAGSAVEIFSINRK